MKISLNYYKGIVSENVLQTIDKELNHVGVEFLIIDETNVPKASLDQFISQIQVIISNEAIQGLALGVASNTIYAGIKTSCASIYDALKNKTCTKTYAGGKTKEIPATFGIKFNSPGRSFDLQFPSDLESSLKEKCIDEAFNFMQEKNSQEITEDELFNGLGGEQYCRYNPDTSKWELVNILEEIDKIREANKNR